GRDVAGSPAATRLPRRMRGGPTTPAGRRRLAALLPDDAEVLAHRRSDGPLARHGASSRHAKKGGPCVSCRKPPLLTSDGKRVQFRTASYAQSSRGARSCQSSPSSWYRTFTPLIVPFSRRKVTTKRIWLKIAPESSTVSRARISLVIRSARRRVRRSRASPFTSGPRTWPRGDPQ